MSKLEEFIAFYLNEKAEECRGIECHEQIAAARKEQADLIAALRWAMIRVGDTSYNDLKNPETFKAAFKKYQALMDRFPDPETVAVDSAPSVPPRN